MPAPTKGARLGSSPAHERLMLANLATSLFRHGRITTTVTKAKRVRPLAERLITKAKRGDLHARRQVLTVIRDRDVSTALFDDIGPRYATRPGGYTRIVKVGPRRGDAAPMAIVELVGPMPETPAEPAAGGGRRRRARREESVAALAGDSGEADDSASAVTAVDPDDAEAVADGAADESDESDEFDEDDEDDDGATGARAA